MRTNAIFFIREIEESKIYRENKRIFANLQLHTTAWQSSDAIFKKIHSSLTGRSFQ